MDKRTEKDTHKQKSLTAGVHRFFQWRLTEHDKRFLRTMNISPE